MIILVREISLTFEEADRILEIIEYYIEEIGLVPEKESLDDVDPELFKIMKRIEWAGNIV